VITYTKICEVCGSTHTTYQIRKRTCGSKECIAEMSRRNTVRMPILPLRACIICGDMFQPIRQGHLRCKPCIPKCSGISKNPHVTIPCTTKPNTPWTDEDEANFNRIAFVDKPSVDAPYIGRPRK
jgi:hypothetical protein